MEAAEALVEVDGVVEAEALVEVDGEVWAVIRRIEKFDLQFKRRTVQDHAYQME